MLFHNKKYFIHNKETLQRYILIVIEITFFLIFKCSSHYTSYTAEVNILAGRSMKGIQGAQIKANGETQKLQLTPMKNIWSNAAEVVSVRKSKCGRTILKRKKVPRNIKVYEDADKGSILGRKGRKLTGIIDSQSFIKYEDGKHVITKSYNISFTESDAVRPPKIRSFIKELLSNKTRDKNKAQVIVSRKIPASRTKIVYEPEIAVLVDSTLANRIGSDSKIQEYLSVFWNGVKKRFDTIDDPKINIKLVGAVIFRSSSDEPFPDHIENEDKYLSSDSIIENLGKWAYSRLETLPDHDILYFQTGKNMTSITGETDSVGKAYVRVACQKYIKEKEQSFAVAVGEDRDGFYYGVITAAHEIAHNLGAEHDFKTNAENSACLKMKGYIMGHAEGDKNALHFSECSIEYMTKYLSTDEASCLRTSIKESKKTGVFTTTKLPGEVLSMTEQCRYITGNNQAKISQGNQSEDSLCYNLRCEVRDNSIITTITSNTPAAEGSLCPSGNRCIDGACVKDKGYNKSKAFF